MTATTSLRERAVEVIARLRAPALMFDSDRRALADALEAALSTTPAGEWMPIASAPKDRKRILLANASGGRFIGRYEHGEGWLDDSSRFRDPTHWQPLPPPPEPATQEETP